MPVPGRAILAALSTALMVSSAVFAQAQEERVSSGSRNCHEQLSDVSLDLYELCVAYCYADCSLSDLDANCRPGDPEILEKYNNLMRPGDPPMPCVRSGCPCFSAEDLRRPLSRDLPGRRVPRRLDCSSIRTAPLSTRSSGYAVSAPGRTSPRRLRSPRGKTGPRPVSSTIVGLSASRRSARTSGWCVMIF